MKKSVMLMLLCTLFLLSGCSLLNREYSNVQPHSASYYESENSSVLRAEGYQDLVNDLLLLVSQHSESGTIALYLTEPVEDVDALVQQACQEVQSDTPMGSYAADFLTYTLSEEHNYIQITANIGYRRTAEQLRSIVYTTSLSALKTLLTTAAEDGSDALVLQVSYFGDQQQNVYDIVSEVQGEFSPETAPWQVNFYPNADNAGVVEILMKTENEG